MKWIFLILVLLLPFQAYSRTCIMLEDKTFEWNQRYTGKVDGKHRTWYSVRAEMVRKHFITVIYGFDGCDGIEVTKQVVFN